MMIELKRLMKKRRKSRDYFVDLVKSKRKKICHTASSKSDSATTNFKIVLHRVDKDKYIDCKKTCGDEDEYKPTVQILPKLKLCRIDSFIRSNLNNNIFSPLKINQFVSEVEFSSVQRIPISGDYEGFKTVTTNSIVSMSSKSMYLPNVVDSYSRKCDYRLQNGRKTVLKDLNNVVDRIETESSNKFMKIKNMSRPFSRGRENTGIINEKEMFYEKPKVVTHSGSLSNSVCSENSSDTYNFTNITVLLNKSSVYPSSDVHHRTIVKEQSLKTTSFVEQNNKITRRKVKQKLKIKKTIGIDVLSSENDFQQNCTEIIQKCVAENVKNVVLSNNERILHPESIEQYSGVMTRRKAAALAISDSFQNEKDKQKMKKNLNVSFETPVSVQEYFHNRSPHLRKSHLLKTGNRFLSLKKENVTTPKFLRHHLKSHTENSKRGKPKKNLDISLKTKIKENDNASNKTLRLRKQNKSTSFSADNPYTIKNRNYLVKGNTSSKEMTEISSKSKNMSSSVSCDRDEDAFCGFDHCMTTDTSIYKNLSSYVETLIQKSPKKVRTKKRMSKAEANYKTELFNMCKKAAECNSGSIRTSRRLQLKRMKKFVASKCALEKCFKTCSATSTKRRRPALKIEKKDGISVNTPNLTNRSSYERIMKQSTPYVRLEKLNNADISSYKITPLREERWPSLPKTEDDYGIDDVNTDDSTDDEELPKKCLPSWVREVKRNLAARYYPQSFLPPELSRSWMKPPDRKSVV